MSYGPTPTGILAALAAQDAPSTTTRVASRLGESWELTNRGLYLLKRAGHVERLRDPESGVVRWRAT